MKPLVHLCALCATLGVLSSAARAEGGESLRRIAEAEAAAVSSPERALGQLDEIIMEAMQSGRADVQVSALQAHARISASRGAIEAAAEEVQRALELSRQFGLVEAEPGLARTMGEIALLEGDVDLATAWLERAFRLALGALPQQKSLAREVLSRLVQHHRSLGDAARAAQSEAWLALLANDPSAPPSGVDLQPLRMQSFVATDEIGRARLVLANATTSPVTGTLWLDPSRLLVRDWASKPSGQGLVLGFPTGSTAASGLSHGKKITLGPGEVHSITVELEPATPARIATESIGFTWQAGGQQVTSQVHFHFASSADLNNPGVANASHLRLNPYLSLPIYEEIYLRQKSGRRIESFLPAASAPCRVEVYELGQAGGVETRTLLAVDAEGDGSFAGTGDELLADADGDEFPDVVFSQQKPVAALELVVFPLPPAGAEALDLTLSLREGREWRQPPDALNRVEAR